MPLLAFLTFDREPEQYLCSAVLRHGKAVASEGGVALLARLLPLLRCAFPRARFLVRLDGGFASPALFDFLGAQPRLDYVVAMASNAVLLRHAEPAMLVARARSEPVIDYSAGESHHPHHRGGGSPASTRCTACMRMSCAAPFSGGVSPVFLVAVGSRVAPVPRTDPYVRANAYGSYLGWLTANRVSGQGCRTLTEGQYTVARRLT